MSIQLRLNLLFGALLALALVSMISAMIFSAGPRVRAENDSIVRLTHEFIETAIETLHETPNPAASLDKLLDGLSDLRHVRIYLDGSPAARSITAEPPQSWPRRWLSDLIRSDPVQKRLPVVVNGRDLGTVVIAPQAGDEIGEVLDAIGNITSRGLLLAVAVFALTSFVIHRALRPIDTLGRALGTLQAGDYGVRLAPAGPPEIARIASSLNDLAAELDRTREQNRWLSQKVIRVEDDERRELARELHDELGPYLFAVRAGATSMKREIARGAETELGRVKALCGTMLEQIDAIQRTNRRVLHKLRPVGLNELGLAASLQGIVAMWRKDHPDIEVALALAPGLDRLDDTVALTVHRVVQEGLTNAFRHAAPSRIAITVARDSGAAGDDGTAHDGASGDSSDDETRPATAGADTGRPAPRTGISVTVQDDGIGLAAPVKDGFGITGMRERVWALGGEVGITNAEGGGARLDAFIPTGRAG